MDAIEVTTPTTTTTTSAAPPPPEPPPTWARTRRLMRSDFERLLERVEDAGSPLKRVFWFLQPTQLGMAIYRVSHHLYRHGWRNAGRLLYTLNLYLTRIDIPPTTVIGEGCLLGHFPIVLCGRIGKRFTFWGDGGIGGGFGSEDIGGGPGLPVVGDDVTMAVRALVLGPVRVGDGARLGPSCTVMRDVPAGGVVAGPVSRIMAGDGAQDR